MNGPNLHAVRIALLATTLACSLVALGDRGRAQEAARVDRADDYDLTKEAKGKILYLTLKHADEATGDSYTVFLVKARMAKLGGSLLIVGTGYAAEDEEDAWYKDMTIGVAWDSVLAFHIMTEKQYKEFIANPAEEDSQAARERRVR